LELRIKFYFQKATCVVNFNEEFFLSVLGLQLRASGLPRLC
jgi:hypothetical protein